MPQTGLAMVHAGESITPAGRPRGSDDHSAAPINVNIELTGPLAPLSKFVDARVLKNYDSLAIKGGKQVNVRQRAGRT